jgi:hypothetical protein
MSLARPAFFEKTNAERQYDKMSKMELMQIIAETFAVPIDTLTNSTFFEEQILKHARSIDKEALSGIPDDHHTVQGSSWDTNTQFFEKAFVVRYPMLTRLQREQIVQAYNEHYGSMARTYESLSQQAFSSASRDGIFFSKSEFFKHIRHVMNEQTSSIRVGI